MLVSAIFNATSAIFTVFEPALPNSQSTFYLSEIPNADIFKVKILLEKMVKIEAQITVVAGSYGGNWQRRHWEFFSKDWAKIYFILV